MDRTIDTWQAQPRQWIFQNCTEYEALYGGAAGGGKSDALLTEALRQIAIPNYRGLILRKTYPQLSELIDRSRYLYRLACPRARYNASSHEWTFPSGAKILFGSMQHVSDRVNYQGRRFDYIAFDELTHFTWDEYSYMFSRNRPSGSGTRVYMRAATNPGGIGHGWVKSRFITPAPPMTTITENVKVKDTRGTEAVMPRTRIFVPSTVFDNRALLDADPEYLASLALLPEAEREALLYGSWDSFSGQAFREWKNDSAHYKDQTWTHVIEPFNIPSHWRIWRGFDFGYAKPFAVGWFAVDTIGRMIQIAEYYGMKNGMPNTGIEINPAEIAANIRRIESEHPLLKGKKIIGIADPSIFDESRGESIASMMSRTPNFVTFAGGDNTRLAGKMQFHYRLAFDDFGVPMFQVFNTCIHTIRTIPDLVYDERHVEDINTNGEDHIYDMIRYVMMEMPITPNPKDKKRLLHDDPLDIYASREHDRYAMYKF